jgi:hypothetical protein
LRRDEGSQINVSRNLIEPVALLDQFRDRKAFCLPLRVERTGEAIAGFTPRSAQLEFTRDQFVRTEIKRVSNAAARVPDRKPEKTIALHRRNAMCMQIGFDLAQPVRAFEEMTEFVGIF